MPEGKKCQAGVEDTMSDPRRSFLRRVSSLAAVAAASGLLVGSRIDAAGPDSRVAQKRALRTSKAAAPIGPFSQGIQVGNLIFVAGLTGIDVNTGKIVPGGIAAETRQALENIQAILAEAGATLENAVSSTVHMTDLSEFQEMNEVYGKYFHKDPPGRTTVQVVAIPAGARVEITIVAAI
jgi:2-iminobutanoate/2-iminopropanoate deaminase